MARISQAFSVRNVDDNPSYYLGCELKMKGKDRHLSCGKYIGEALRMDQNESGTIRRRTFY